MDKVFVERDAVIKAVCDSRTHTCHLDNCEKGCEEFRAILSVPAADVRPVVRGKWDRENNPSYSPFDGSSEYIYRCNQCGENNDRDSVFCPNCGAMMEDH